MTAVDPKLARFAADLNDAYEKVCADPKHNGFFDLFKEVEIKLYTYGDLTAKFWEEGIEFYPTEDAK